MPIHWKARAPTRLTTAPIPEWVDLRAGAGGGLWRDFGQTIIYADQLCWVTGDDAVWRDPASWVINGSNDNSTWTNLWEASTLPPRRASRWPERGRCPAREAPTERFLSFF